MNQRQIFGRQGQGTAHFRRKFLFGTINSHSFFDEIRPHQPSAIANCRQKPGNLQRSGQHIPLSNSCIDRITIKQRLIEVSLFPSVVWHHPNAFGHAHNIGGHAQAQGTGIIRQQLRVLFMQGQTNFIKNNITALGQTVG